MKRYTTISNVSVMALIPILLILFATIITYIQTHPYQALIVMCICVLIYCSCYIYYKISLKISGLPGTSIYNPLGGFVELHIESKNKSIKDFYRIAARTILISREKKKDVLIDSWIIDKKVMSKYFEGAYKYLPIPIWQIYTNYSNMQKYLSEEDRDKAKAFRAVVYTGNLSVEQLNKLKRFI